MDRELKKKHAHYKRLFRKRYRQNLYADAVTGQELKVIQRRVDTAVKLSIRTWEKCKAQAIERAAGG